MITLPPPNLAPDIWAALEEMGVTMPKPVQPDQRTGVRRCVKCNTLYAAAAAMPSPWECIACHSIDTIPIEPASPPSQTVFFTLPAPPAPNAWRIEWRWKANPTLKQRARCRPEPDWMTSPGVVWQEWNHYNITCEKSARNRLHHLQHVFPWRNWRLKVVGFTPTPLLP